LAKCWLCRHEHIAPQTRPDQTRVPRILFGFGRELLAVHAAKVSIAVRNVHNGMIVETADRTALAIRAALVGAV
jgi:hypothetical protein